MVLAEITWDLWADEPNNRLGAEWTFQNLESIGWFESAGEEVTPHHFEDKQTPFRLMDADGEIYYKGWLRDDPWALVQDAVLNWGMHDAGCTEIQVYKNGKWVAEIG